MATYIFVYMTETDGEMVVESLNKAEILSRIRQYRLTEWDYAIIEGTIIKGLNNLTGVSDLI